MIFQEEQIFRQSLAAASGIKYPEPPIDDSLEAMEKHVKQKSTYEKKLQKAIETAQETKEIPDGVHGLVPEIGRAHV